MHQTKIVDPKMIKLWKEKEVEKVVLQFTCGGDSMGDTDFTVYYKNGEEETTGDLVDYFGDSIYDHVEFYVNSDGHYEGEAGIVEITLNEDESDFEYSKSSTSEWNESANVDAEVILNRKQLAFVKEHVLNINGGEDGETTINYKHDFIMTDAMDALVEKLTENVESEIKATLDSLDVESLNDWYSFTTNEEGDLKIEGSKLIITLTYSYTEYRDGD